jgi:hypothetical protein
MIFDARRTPGKEGECGGEEGVSQRAGVDAVRRCRAARRRDPVVFDWTTVDDDGGAIGKWRDYF